MSNANKAHKKINNCWNPQILKKRIWKTFSFINEIIQQEA